MTATGQTLKTVLGLLACASAWLLVGAAPAASADLASEFRRGIGLSHVMGWAEVEPGPAHAFAFPPFADESRNVSANCLRSLRSTGFDFVRLAVDPGPFLQFQGARRDELDRILMDRVKLILASGLAVIVDFQPSDLQPDYTAQALTAGVTTPVFQDYLRMLARTAGLLGELHSDKVGFELMNEPPVQPSAWQPMLEAAYAAVRGRAAELPLLLEGGDEASPAALMAMTTGAFAADRAVLFVFHYYDPYQFTHQGASWNAAHYLADVPYPALARPLEDSLEASAAMIAKSDLPQSDMGAAYREARTRLESYRRSAFDRRAIAKTFDLIAAWARANQIPADRIMLGEFGARKTEFQRDATERESWFRDVRTAADAHGFGWAVWTYRGEGGFALARGEANNDIDPGIAAALGLNVQRKAADMPASGARLRTP